VELLGVGPLEVMLVIVLVLVLFGPHDIAQTARSVGRFLNRVYRSEAWKTMTSASSALRTLPNRLAREAELEELDQARRELQQPLDEPAAAPPPASGMQAWAPRYPRPAAGDEPEPPEG
jgi:Sec-independent protein translocase protein TatA